ncbi:MAG: FAD:protein FMN transferase [Chloroflexota bacterium]
MVHRLAFRAMGTEMLACVDNGSDTPPAQLADVPRWFEEWEQTLSRFRPDSELARLNRAGRPVQVSETLWQVFRSALEAERLTEGLVTPTVAEAVIAAGYDRDFAQLQSQETLQSGAQNLPILQTPSVPSLSAIEWDETTRAISLPPGIRLDFGGVAKGWAAGQAVERLKGHGSALMNCGGDIAMSGPLLNGAPWEIGIYKPFDRAADYVEMLYFQEACGTASSTTDRRRWTQDGQLRHHIIDPRTGRPAETDVVHATLVAPSAVEAEAAAKSVLIRGSMDGLDWLESHPELAGLLILESGEILYSQRIVEFL